MKNRKMLFSALMALMLVIAGCESLQDMLESASKVKYVVLPHILEAKGGNVDFEIRGTFPEKFFIKTAILEITPILKCSNGEEIILESYKVQGEEVADNFKVISSVSGGSFAHTISIPFEARMRKSELFIKVSGTLEDSKLEFPEVKIAEGVNATSTLSHMDPKTISVKDEFIRTVSKSFQSDIHYQIQRSNISRKEKRSADMKEFADVLKSLNADSRKELKNISLLSYASPDGALKLNTRLANSREKSAARVLKRVIKKSKVNVEKNQIVKEQIAEDWNGFKSLMEKSEIHDRNLILRVLEMYTDPVKREAEIKNISKAYEEIANNVLPKLRRSKFLIKYDLTGRSDDEILDTINKLDPATSKLDIEEILYAATLVKSNDDKIKIYNIAKKLYPKSVRVLNNLAVCFISKKENTKAIEVLESAIEINPTNKSFFNNLAVVYMLNDSIVLATEEISKAQNVTSEAYYNGAILALLKGDYENAASNFGQWQTYNVALCNYLAGDADKALEILKGLPEEGDNLYLQAVVACFKNDTDLMFSSLMKAVSQDDKYKQLAKTDIEFAQHFQDEKFIAIVQ